jgi:hypothetical protein
MATEKFTCQQVIDVLKATRGMVYLAAESLGCSHVTVYNYIKRHPSIRLAWESFSGQVGDIAETRLFDAIERDESWAIAFYLKTKGKNRGYVERKEVSGKDGGKIQVETSFDGEQHARAIGTLNETLRAFGNRIDPQSTESMDSPERTPMASDT